MTPRASIFGGNWWNEDDAGSRRANLDYWNPENSNENIGARGRCDDRIHARRRSRSRRQATARIAGAIKIGGQPGCPASANTFHGPAERGVAYCLTVVRRDPRPAISSVRGSMARRYRNLIGRIVDDRNMLEAYRLTATGKRLSRGYLDFKEFGALNLGRLADDLAAGRYRPGEPTEFWIFDPKRRLISALPFRDRVAQTAVASVIGPIFDRALLPNAYACREGKGTHAGVKAVQAELRRMSRGGAPVYFLKTDFSRYFASIERGALWRLIEAKISCDGTLRILESMLPRTGIGLPIGNLTSQIFANLYAGTTLDRHLQQDLGERCWYRYMDDLVVLGRSSEHLRRLKEDIETFSRDRLRLRFSKWQVAPAHRGINFLGFRIWATHKLLRRDSVTRARRKIAAMRARGDDEALALFLPAWLGHAQWADSGNLIRSFGLEIERTAA